MKPARQFLLLALIVATAGCASPRTNLIARTGGTPMPPQIHNVSLMPRASQSPAEKTLETQLTAELTRRGINVVPQSESDFTVAAVIEENWDTFTRNVYPQTVRHSHLTGAGSAGFSTLVTVEQDPLHPEKVEDHIRTEGIRLRLYRTAELKQGNFQTAWDGYLEAGLSLRPEQQPGMLQILCDYLGRDFIGHVKTRK